jgi:hypothetical protein
MTRYLVPSIVVLALAVAGLAVRADGSARGSSAADAVLRVGDTMKVEGAPLGCQVTQRNGRVVVDCRRAGSLAGTYGTLLDERRVRVARFRSSDTAKVVFKARHRGQARPCHDSKAARR